jgi:hypothetical protein
MRSGVAVRVGCTGVTVGVAEWEGNGDGDGEADGGVAGSGVPQEAASNDSSTNQKVSFFIG